jgi:hypothetical protein
MAGILSCLVKGAIAGGVGVWLMDRVYLVLVQL